MLEEKVLNDYKVAMKNKDTLKSSLLSFLRAEFINLAVEKKKKSLDDSDCIAVIRKQIKQHQDSVEQFKKGNRLDLAEKEAKELEILQSYLPKQMSEQEIKKIIEEVVSATGASTMKDMGAVMKEVKVRTGENADARVISELVRQRLSPPPVPAA